MSPESFLRAALDEAHRGRGLVAPNPAVGAVLVQKDFIVSKGYHHGPGLPHAEVEALSDVREPLGEATLYVTLEPCCHHGRTPPCTRFLIERGIKRVVYGHQDPNPVVAGKGEAELRAAGVEVTHLPLPEVERFYQSYDHWTRTGRPFVTAKLALSLDGKIAGPEGRPVPLTGERLQKLTHEGRLGADAILTTARTINADDPRLNVRLTTIPRGKRVYVLAHDSEVNRRAKIFETAEQVVILRGRDLSAALKTIGADGCHDLWVEAGGTLFESLVTEGLAQRALLYLAPKWLGDSSLSAFSPKVSQALSRAEVRWEAHGRDALCELMWN